MKRNQARAVNLISRNLKASEVNSNTPHFSSDEITPAHIIRLIDGSWYEQEDIAKVAECLMNELGYNTEHQFEVVGGLPQLNSFLHNSELPALSQQPIFIIYNKGGNHWVTFCITNFDNSNIVLYKDSFGEEISDGLKEIIKGCYIGPIFKSHVIIEQRDGQSCGPMSLKNLEIILQGLKADVGSFINNFENTKFCSQDDVQKIRVQFKDKLQKQFSQKFLQLVNDLSQDETFKERLNEFLAECCKCASASKSMGDYHRALQEIVLDESNLNYEIQSALEEARNNFFEHDYIKKIIEKQENAPQVTKTAENNIIKPDLMKDYPTQMAKFTEIFDLLSKCERNDKLEKVLQNVSKMLGLNYDQIKQFFEVGRKKEGANSEKVEVSVKPKDINAIRKLLPPSKNNSGRPMETPGKTLEQLLSEIALGNSYNALPTTNVIEESKLTANELREHYRRKYINSKEILQLERGFKQVKEHYQNWQSKADTDVLEWARTIRPHKIKETELYEAIAIMDRANEIVTGGDQLRDVQILTVLTFLELKEKKGTLCQVSTGEGKTVIVSILAALKVLQGEKVDVITSNQVLANEGVEKRENFYGLLDISVATNNIDESYTQGPKACYAADIVYGNIGNFQFDYLRDWFEGLETRADREFGCVILDEVDSMLVDNGGYIAKLAGPFPGIDLLKYVYVKIWQELHKAEQTLCEDLEQNLLSKAKELKIKEAVGTSEEILQGEYESFKAGLVGQLFTKLKNKIIASNPANIELIPTHLKEYANDMVGKWIDNAIYAKYQCRVNEQYVIKKRNDEDIVVPVDYLNTGVTLKNTIWSNGLHQFVQLKHNLCLTSESLTSSFISNIGYIKLYSNNILGLTGTLGSLAEQKLLSTVYDVGYVRIPTYKPKKFVEVDGIVVKNEQWINCIALDSLMLAYQGRSVLIICKTIKDLLDLEKNIKALKKLEGFDELKIKTYPDEDNCYVVDDVIGASVIIIATNIAGRGTDLKTTEELENNGGLHVCVSFLPVNRRVEDQAFGRTSRQGKAGTAQLIIRESDVLELGMTITPDMGFEAIKEKRNRVEILRLEKVKNAEVAETEFQDRIFSKFSDKYRKFKQEQDENSSGLFVIKDLKEFWAFWLQKKKFENFSLTEVENEFDDFKEKATGILNGKISHNPYYSVLQAEHFLSNGMVDEAETAIKHAIALSKEHAGLLYSAHLKLFEVEIERGDQMRERFKKALKDIFFISNGNESEEYKGKAKAALEAAKDALEKEIHYLQIHFIGQKSISEGARDDTLETLTLQAVEEALEKEIHYHQTLVMDKKSISDGSDGEKSETFTNSDFQNILTVSEGNLLIKHIVSRFVILKTFHFHICCLLDQVNTTINCESSKGKGIVIKTRIPNYLRKLDPMTDQEKKLKDAITGAELSELGLIGLETIYAVREVHDAHAEVINRAKGQIGSGLLVLASGVAFPPAMPVVGPIAGTLISEGICDVVMELISQGETGFNEKAYVKSKCISYGIAIVTMGISAIAKSTKILDKAIKACKGLADTLRKCPVFSKLCNNLACQLDKLADYLTKAKYLREQIRALERLTSSDLKKLRNIVGSEKFAQLQRMQDLGKLNIALSRFQIFTKELTKIGMCTMQSVVGSVISEKIVAKGLEGMLMNLKPKIVELVKSAVEKEMTLDELKLIDDSIINETMMSSVGETATDILKEVAFGALRHCHSWKCKISSLALDSMISTVEIVNVTKKYCLKLRENLRQLKEASNRETDNARDNKEIVMLITTQIADKIYELIMRLVGKYAHTLAINPVMNKVWSSVGGGGTNENLSAEDLNTINNFYEIVDSYEVLGLEVGASVDEIKQARIKKTFEFHPDRNKSKGASEKYMKIQNAFEHLTQVYNNIPTPKHFPLMLPNYNRGQQLSRNSHFQDVGLEEAHIGHIHTLSENTKQYIIVKSERTGKVIMAFGEKFRTLRNPMIVNYSPPSDEKPGHYSIPAEVNQVIMDQNIQLSEPLYENNCLYDSLAPQFQAQGLIKSAQDIRRLAEKPSFDNFYYGMLVTVSNLLNNPITAGMFLDLQSAFLVGGKRHIKRYIQDDFYPSSDIKIIVGFEFQDVLAKLRGQLNILKKEADDFSNSKTQSQYVRHQKSYPCFGWDPTKSEMMMGAIEVKFNDNTTLKLLTVSGDTRFYTRVRDNAEKTKIFFSYECDGFTFIDPGNIRDKSIFDLNNHVETKLVYNKTCAAQKLLYFVGEHLKRNLKSNDSLKIVEIKLAESWFEYKKSKIPANLIGLEGSCPMCSEVLPVVTGGLKKNSDNDC